MSELNRLPALHEDCARQLAGSPGPAQEKTTGGALPGMSLNTAALEARSAIQSVLASWSGAVAEERGLPAPRRAVGPLSDFLVRHAGWLAAHPAAGDLSQETARVTRRARQVIDPAPRRAVPIGACVEHGCAGALTAVVRPDRTGLPSEIRCDASPAHRWPGPQWLQLRRRLTARTPPSAAPEEDGTRPTGTPDARAGSAGTTPAPTTSWLTAADVARLWDIPSGTVYRHASQQKWRRRRSQGRTFYHDADVHRTLTATGR